MKVFFIAQPRFVANRHAAVFPFVVSRPFLRVTQRFFGLLYAIRKRLIYNTNVGRKHDTALYRAVTVYGFIKSAVRSDANRERYCRQWLTLSF